ncbi:hypothetical protein [Sporolactobacillus spathodeae]|uniref:Membrane-anchored protein n=1 Tax=Sporolactobacillus spathodeae TaxID=1465502 RepID=A0ABS2Q9E5_9BACL|nr:hypothetical protein [Sporolactobacillus spathodeae]MBM7658402.1 putative membrane-anchored protein [Sporolactobacillus spathodeae]
MRLFSTELKFNTSYLFSKVPEITLLFWITKVVTTGMGEVFSDYLVKQINPIVAVALGGLGLLFSLLIQFAVRRYIASIYWLVVVMVSIFGTMAADVIHVVLGIPYLVSTLFFAAALCFIFYLWYRVENTLSIHSIFTARREFFYWATVLTTFALGTAWGDLSAATFQLGYFLSGILFSIMLLLPALLFIITRNYAVLTFWFAYVMTRPVGASFSDWLSKAHNVGGVGFGEGSVSLVLTFLIIGMVGYLQMNQKNVRRNLITPQQEELLDFKKSIRTENEKVHN